MTKSPWEIVSLKKASREIKKSDIETQECDRDEEGGEKIYYNKKVWK